MYQASVPRFVNILGNLSAILDKAQAYIDAKKIDPAVLPMSRLFPDMLPMKSQFRLRAIRRRASWRGSPASTSLHETRADNRRSEGAHRQVRRVPRSRCAEKIDGTEDKEIVIKRPDRETRYTGIQFLVGTPRRISTST
jgi:hypothetical protein